MTTNINNNFGYVYAFPIRIGGILIAFIGLFISLSMGWSILLGLLLVLVGVNFASASTGVLIDIEHRAVKHYTSRFLIRFGEWREYPTYRNIAIIRKNKKRHKFYQQDNSEGEAAYKYEIYLISRSHRGKVLLEVSFTREDAEFRAQRYCEQFPAELVEYQPPARTKKRIRKQKRSSDANFND